MLLDSESCITYPKATSLIRNWQPESPLVNELLLAALTTCLVYQATRIVLDVTLGQKKRGEIRVTDLSIFIIISSLSLKSILSSFGCRGYLAKTRFHGKNRTCDAKHREERRLRRIDLAKYLILLAAAPTIHILAIYMTVESEKVVSFRDANFGGASLGINDRGPALVSESATCPLLCANYGSRVSHPAMFYRCYQENKIPFANGYPKNKYMVILRASQGDIGVTVVTPGGRWISFLHIDIQIGDVPYRLENTMTEQERQNIFEKGINEMIPLCDANVTNDADTSQIIPPDPSQRILAVDVECKDDAPNQDTLTKIASTMLSDVTLAESEQFRVAERADVQTAPGPYFDASDKDLLIRRRSVTSFLAIAIATAVTFTLRVIIGLLLNNDANMAVETIVKDHLGIKCCDSMLQAENEVSYKNDVEVDGHAVRGNRALEEELGYYDSAFVDDMVDD